jgi:hypothetical protein
LGVQKLKSVTQIWGLIRCDVTLSERRLILAVLITAISTCVSSCPSPEVVNGKGGKVYFGLQFWRFHTMVALLLWVVVRQHTMAGNTWWASCSPHGWDMKKKKRDQAPTIPFEGKAPVT